MVVVDVGVVLVVVGVVDPDGVHVARSANTERHHADNCRLPRFSQPSDT